ncbi:hypothetical protein LPJ56_001630 [Coemansia sp. RSA 2599]|nr:hypothetical protein LPJ56_001630 [Coemansia sp. RSA 2599]
MAAENAIVDWALQFYCTMDDQDMIDDTDLEFQERQPWASPLNLQRIAKPRLDKSLSGSGTESLEPFSLPSGKRKRRTSTLNRRSGKRSNAGSSAEPVDLAAVIYLLITTENARRLFAAEFLSKKQSQGSVADRSERWQHHFAKRNIAAETQFENALVALKELVVLQAIANPGAARTGELKQGLDYIAKKSARPGELADAVASSSGPSAEFDASHCLAILNLMFPLDPLHADRRHSLSTNRLQQRYAFPLQHVPNPRMQLHQLLCEVEAWVNGDKRMAASIASQGSNSNERAFGASSNSAFGGIPRRPTKCPAWVASAQGFAWGQLKQSCLSYLHNAQQKIMEHHRKIHPWSPEVADSTAAADAPAAGSDFPIDDDDNMEADADAAEPCKRYGADILRINRKLLKDVDKQLPSDSTVIERIICHAQLVEQSLSTRAVYDVLSKK